jgi:hypothetical protein
MDSRERKLVRKMIHQTRICQWRGENFSVSIFM